MPVYNTPLLTIDRAETRRYAGLRGDTQFPDDLLDQACMAAKLLAKPRGCWQIYSYCTQTATIKYGTGFTLASKSITRHLAEAVKIAVCAVTIGDDLEHAVSEHFAKGEYTAGLLLDAAGSSAVETIADAVNALIADQEAQSGYSAIRRFSPGYGDWSITDQSKILALAGADVINLSATTSCMLQPRKSVTAIIGLTATTSHQSSPNDTGGNCQACPLHSCFARKEQLNDILI
jgi:hypothetical protein